MVSAERETIKGAGGRVSSGVQGQSQWSRGRPFKLKDFLHYHNLRSPKICFYAKNSSNVSGVGHGPLDPPVVLQANS